MNPPKITEDDWTAWKEHPITQLVMQALEATSIRAERQWKIDAWSNEYLSAEGRERQIIALNRVKARIDGYAAIRDMTLADLLSVMDLEPAEEG